MRDFQLDEKVPHLFFRKGLAWPFLVDGSEILIREEALSKESQLLILKLLFLKVLHSLVTDHSAERADKVHRVRDHIFAQFRIVRVEEELTMAFPEFKNSVDFSPCFLVSTRGTMIAIKDRYQEINFWRPSAASRPQRKW